MVVDSYDEAQYIHGYLTSSFFALIGSTIAVEKNFTSTLYNKLPIIRGVGQFRLEDLLDRVGATEEERQWVAEMI